MSFLDDKRLPGRFTAKVVGVTFVAGYPDNLYRLEALAADRYLGTDAAEPIPVVLRRNPHNEHDANAVEVHVPALDSMIGHLPGAVAGRLAPELDAGELLLAHVVSVLVHPDAPSNPGISVELRRVEQQVPAA